MALYPKATKKLLPLDPKMDPPEKMRVVILHVADNELTSLYNYFNGPSGGVESHFYVRYDGTVEQYRDTGWQADANMMANPFAISIETQGLGPGTWTAAQLAAIKDLLLWCHTTHGIPLAVPATWDGTGIGYHTLFEDQWDQRHATCPGPNRIQQFKNDIVPWMAAGGDDMPSPDDLWHYALGTNPGDATKQSDAANALAIARNYSYYAYQKSLALEAAITALAAGLGDEVKKAVADALAAKYDATVTLTPKAGA